MFNSYVSLPEGKSIDMDLVHISGSLLYHHVGSGVLAAAWEVGVPALQLEPLGGEKTKIPSRVWKKSVNLCGSYMVIMLVFTIHNG